MTITKKFLSIFTAVLMIAGIIAGTISVKACEYCRASKNEYYNSNGCDFYVDSCDLPDGITREYIEANGLCEEKCLMDYLRNTTWNIGKDNPTDVTARFIPDDPDDIFSEGTLLVEGTGATKDFVNVTSGISEIPWRNAVKCFINKIVVDNGITTIGIGIFRNTKRLKQVVLPDTLTTISRDAFSDCENLTDINIPDSLEKVGYFAFGGVSEDLYWSIAEKFPEMRDYDLEFGTETPSTNNTTSTEPTQTSGSCGENVTWSFDTSTGILTISGTGDMNDYESKSTGTSVKYTAPWKNCDIKQVKIENGVTRIGSDAFNNCGGELKIPDSVTSIGDKAWVKWSFFNSPENESITIPKTVLKIGEKAFGYFRNTEYVDDLVLEKITNFKIYCYAGTAGEQYAKDNGFEYEILSDKENPPQNPNNNTNKSNQTVGSKNKGNTSTTKVTVPKPAKVKSVKLTAKKKKLNVKWKKVSGATGYEVTYATNNKFTKNKKTVKVKKNKVTINKLKSKKKYFVKVRAYKKVKGNVSYGKWSKVVKKKVR